MMTLPVAASSAPSAHRPRLLLQATYYFIGIAGDGMSPLAQVAHRAGLRVAGSDAQPADSPKVLALTTLGITVSQQTADAPPTLPDGPLVVVRSTAIRDTHPELQAALAHPDTQVIHRAAFLAALIDGLLPDAPLTATLGVSGTHGKTTTTGMIDHILAAWGEAGVLTIAGGKLPNVGSNLRFLPPAMAGAGWRLVAELDESDGSLVQHRPSLAVVTNLEPDHPDHYGANPKAALQKLLETFTTFTCQLQPAAAASADSPTTLILNADCPNLRRLAQALGTTWQERGTRVVWFGTGEAVATLAGVPVAARYETRPVTVTAELPPGGQTVEVVRDGVVLGTLRLNVPGAHNVSNALAAVAACDTLGTPWESVCQGLARFTGMGRRFELIGRAPGSGAWCVDDYAHHPTEVMACLQAARAWLAQQPAPGRVVAVFQPHRHSRFTSLYEDFLVAFDAADLVIVLPVFAAGDPQPDDDRTHAFVDALRERFEDADRVVGCPYPPEAACRALLQSCLQPGDVALGLGAGTITQLFRGWAQ